MRENRPDIVLMGVAMQVLDGDLIGSVLAPVLQNANSSAGATFGERRSMSHRQPV